MTTFPIFPHTRPITLPYLASSAVGNTLKPEILTSSSKTSLF